MYRASFSNVVFAHDKQKKVEVIMLLIVPMLISLLIYRYHCPSQSVYGSGNYFVRFVSRYYDVDRESLFSEVSSHKVKVTSIST